jgi:hypothetical protein
VRGGNREACLRTPGRRPANREGDKVPSPVGRLLGGTILESYQGEYSSLPVQEIGDRSCLRSVYSEVPSPDGNCVMWDGDGLPATWFVYWSPHELTGPGGEVGYPNPFGPSARDERCRPPTTTVLWFSGNPSDEGCVRDPHRRRHPLYLESSTGR